LCLIRCLFRLPYFAQRPFCATLEPNAGLTRDKYMKNSTGIRGFSQISLVAASLCPLLAACSSMNMEDMAPRPQAVSTSSTAQTQQTGPGDYPNLNIAVQ